MSSELDRLAARRRTLIERSEQLRSSLAEDAVEISSHLRVVDRATALLSTRGGKIVVLGGVLLILLTGPGRAFRVVSRAAITWSVARRWLPLLAPVIRKRRRA